MPTPANGPESGSMKAIFTVCAAAVGAAGAALLWPSALDAEKIIEATANHAIA